MCPEINPFQFFTSGKGERLAACEARGSISRDMLSSKLTVRP